MSKKRHNSNYNEMVMLLMSNGLFVEDQALAIADAIVDWSSLEECGDD